jgi:PilZ domain
MTPGKKSLALADWNATRRAERYSSLRDLAVSYEGHGETIATRPPDISPQGMFINTAMHFPEGAVLNVSFRLARTGAKIETRCEVRYCLEGVGVGVEFIDIAPEASQAIEEELRPTLRAVTYKRASSAKAGAKRDEAAQRRNARRRKDPRPRKR